MRRRLLIVEDDALLREMYAAKFELEDYDVTTAADGKAGLEAALANDFDIIILDNLMPYLTGLELLERYRANRPQSDTTIIFLSNKSSPLDINRAKQLGAAEYLIKSQYTPRDLVVRVQERLMPGTSPKHA